MVNKNFKNAIERKERRFGNPRTEAERKRRHKSRFGNAKLPIRGSEFLKK